MSELAVSNDVLRESLRVAEPPPLSVRVEQRLSAWFPTFERRLIDALYWFSERAPWQRGALSMGIGALIGLSMVFAGAGIAGWGQRAAPAASPQAALVAPVAASPRIAPAPVAEPVAAAAPAPTAVPAPEPVRAEPLLDEPERKPARKHAKKRSRLQRRAASKTGAWTFPRPQRRSP